MRKPALNDDDDTAADVSKGKNQLSSSSRTTDAEEPSSGRQRITIQPVQKQRTARSVSTTDFIYDMLFSVNQTEEIFLLFCVRISAFIAVTRQT